MFGLTRNKNDGEDDRKLGDDKSVWWEGTFLQCAYGGEGLLREIWGETMPLLCLLYTNIMTTITIYFEKKALKGKDNHY